MGSGEAEDIDAGLDIGSGKVGVGVALAGPVHVAVAGVVGSRTVRLRSISWRIVDVALSLGA